MVHKKTGNYRLFENTLEHSFHLLKVPCKVKTALYRWGSSMACYTSTINEPHLPEMFHPMRRMSLPGPINYQAPSATRPHQLPAPISYQAPSATRPHQLYTSPHQLPAPISYQPPSATRTHQLPPGVIGRWECYLKQNVFRSISRGLCAAAYIQHVMLVRYPRRLTYWCFCPLK